MSRPGGVLIKKQYFHTKGSSKTLRTITEISYFTGGSEIHRVSYTGETYSQNVKKYGRGKRRDFINTLILRDLKLVENGKC